jgi:hypothetical protein
LLNHKKKGDYYMSKKKIYVGLSAALLISSLSMSTQAATSVNKQSLMQDTQIVQLHNAAPQSRVSADFAQKLEQDGLDVSTLSAADCAILSRVEADLSPVFGDMGASAFDGRLEQQMADEGEGYGAAPSGVVRRCILIISRTGRVPFFCRMFGFGVPS